MRLPDFILFASDATLVGMAAGALLLLAALSLLAEYRRNRRHNIDAVGWMPWTMIFLVSAICGAGLLIFAVKGWVAA